MSTIVIYKSYLSDEANWLRDWSRKVIRDVSANIMGCRVIVSSDMPEDEVWVTNGKDKIVIKGIGVDKLT